MELPVFKYNPNALELEIIREEDTDCPVCRKERSYVYEGPFYSVEEVEGICPWCIADGSAAKKFDGQFQDEDSCEDVENEEYVNELIYKTPGYPGWQQARWLSHCGDFCAFVEYVGWEEINYLEQELQADLSQIMRDYNLTLEELKGMLSDEGSLQGYLFKCLHCNQHRLHVDCT